MKFPDVTAGQVEACINRLGGWEKFILFIGGKGKVVFDQIFTFIGTGLMSAQSAKKLTFDYVCNELRHYGTHSDNFKNQFYDLESPEIEAAEIVVQRLDEETPTGQVLEKLGDKAEVNPLQFLVFLKGNADSLEIFTAFLRGRDEKLWAVTATPGPYFHIIDAVPADGFCTVEEGTYIVSRQ